MKRRIRITMRKRRARPRPAVPRENQQETAAANKIRTASLNKARTPSRNRNRNRSRSRTTAQPAAENGRSRVVRVKRVVVDEDEGEKEEKQEKRNRSRSSGGGAARKKTGVKDEIGRVSVADDDATKDAEIRKYIDQRLGNREHVYIKRLTRALHVGYCRAQKILKEYLDSGTVTKTTGQGYSRIKTEGETSEKEEEEEEEVEEEPEQEEPEEQEEEEEQEEQEEQEEEQEEEEEGEEGEGEEEEGEEEEREEEEEEEEEEEQEVNNKGRSRGKRKRGQSQDRDRGRYVSKLRRFSKPNKFLMNGNSNQISFLHSPEYLREHAEKSATKYKETREMLQNTPNASLKRYQLMGKALLFKWQQNPHLIYPPSPSLSTSTSSHLPSSSLPHTLHTPKHELKLEQKQKQTSARIPPSPPPSHGNHPKPSRPFR